MTAEGASERGQFAVSVVIPLFNKAEFIRETLLAVLGQSWPPSEVIVVDDGSTDDGVAAIADLVSEQVQVILQDNAGPGPARNRGIAVASGEWIALLDADDLWHSDHLATLAGLHEEFPDAEVLATDFKRVPAGNRRAGMTSAREGGNKLVDYFSFDPSAQPFFTSSIAIRSSRCLEVGGFGQYWPGEDSEYWIRLALDRPFAISSRTTACYTQETGGLMDRVARNMRQGFHLQPIFAYLDQALANPALAPRHALIQRFRTRLLLRNVRQSLYRGETGAARAYLREIDPDERRASGSLRLLALLPGPVIKAGIRARALFRRPG